MKNTLLDSLDNADSTNIESSAPNAKAQNPAPESVQKSTNTQDSIKTDSAPQNQSAESAEKALDVGDFEALIQRAKMSLNKLSSQEITLKESIELYQQGMESLKSAQEILESAKLRYQEIKD